MVKSYLQMLELYGDFDFETPDNLVAIASQEVTSTIMANQLAKRIHKECLL